MGYDWFKVHSNGWLNGSIRAQLTPVERSIWIDLLALSSQSRIRGVVCRAKNIPYSNEYLANLLDVPLADLISTIEKCTHDKNVNNNKTRIKIDKYGCLVISNWDKYQDVKPKKKEPLTEKQKDIIRNKDINKNPDKHRDGLTEFWGDTVIEKNGKVH